MAVETTATRRKIVKELQKNKIGLTAREISEDLKIKVQTISATLQQMALSRFVQRGELIEGEGQIWEVTELGIAEYGVKSDLEVKTNFQESVLEKTEGLADHCSCERNELGEFFCNRFDNCRMTENDSFVEIALDAEITVTETEETIAFKHEMTPESFQIWQIVDEAGAKFKQLLEQKQAKQIENIDYKLATLESLADIYNTKISATLREIAADLRG
jgi:DNA-binding Lrp family transcriptional regulator